MRRYALLLAALSVSAAIGMAFVFGNEESAAKEPTEFDLRSRPATAEWIAPAEPDGLPFALTEVPPRELRITSLKGEKFDVQPNQIFVMSNGHTKEVEDIKLLFEKVSRKEAVDQVRDLSRKIGLPSEGFENLDHWASSSKMTPIYVNSPLEREPGIGVGIRQSFDSVKPHFVIVSISWGLADLKLPAELSPRR